MATGTMFFPSDFLWGTATAAHQVEGNNANNDWWQWEQGTGHILQEHRSGLACNWWENAEADLDKAAEMGTNAHRLSLEWSRIEPEPSRFDKNALERYRQILQAMHDRGIEPMVTLHHFTNPLWLVEKGDFGTAVVVDYFQRYTAKVVEVLGDLVPKWVTINEPLVYVFMRYLEGTFPAPQQKGWPAAGQALRNLLRCHAAAYHTIKERQPEAQVGVAKNLVIFAARPSQGTAARWWAKRLNWLYNEAWMEAMTNGRSRFPFGRGQIPHLAGSYDFIGINYYTRFYAKFPPLGGLLHEEWEPGAVVSDGNYGEVYPDGLFQVIKSVLRYDKPIYITENGVPDIKDEIRPSFILTHLREVWRAISFCFPVMGYYHWSLVDNFEWDRGWTQRFGLIAMNPETQERELRTSGQLYTEICQQNQISSEMVAKYAPQSSDILFPGKAPA
ncbi:MAG: glycoside hydrolase family 1 protein [Ardenticatenaceae bacterium]|nr:glycoside hydrolase family 1 protein [Anaerolineales bacterium]MCB8922637.1 glycoside hydrolase family 1 protein [Ardenticatenaceae bacterium]MCB9003655.1 glycoside hydrolase family 1 protein [Ardenticatenaceae bacterium]